MKLGIDATNIKAGGGLTHLKRIVESFDLKDDQLILIGGPWVDKIIQVHGVEAKIFESEFASLWKQELFKKKKLPRLLSQTDLAFIPGGTFSSKHVAYVSMSQNMLVFEEKERNRFPVSLNWLRYKLLEKLQVRSFRHAKGIIYISEYAKNYIENKYPLLKNKRSTVIYHGISDNFRQKPKEQKPIHTYTAEHPFKLSYISIVNFYKHQWNVVEAVKMLKADGFPIRLELIGPNYQPALPRLTEVMKGTENYVSYRGPVPYEEIAGCYKDTDLFVFASTCENMPNILVEAMSAGLPILSSSYGPMPEVLKDGGCYMDPTDVTSIYTNLKRMLEDDTTRANLAQKAYEYSLQFSWEATAKQTFHFLKELATQTH